MFGALRLLLAAMVVASHVGGYLIGDLWIGVVAVVVFFMISGYAMSGLIDARFPDGRNAPSFYLERFLRLAPQYYLWLAASLFVVFGLHWADLNTKGFIPYGLTAYLTIIPLGLQRYLGSVDTLVMSQATTLGIEITFYIFSPWILRSRWLSWAAGLVGLSIYGATALKVLPENVFTYYTSPGPVIFFILGSFLYRKYWISLAIFTAAIMGILAYGLPQRFNIEFLAGVGAGLPVMILLSRFKPNKFDSMLGDASYGCFLCHGIVIWGVEHYLKMTTFTPPQRGMIVVASIVLGYLGYLLAERPTVPLRRRLRGGARRSKLSPEAASP